MFVRPALVRFPVPGRRAKQWSLRFEANQGQQPAQVKFLSRSKDCTVFLTPCGATLSLQKPSSARESIGNLKQEGGNPAVRLTATDPLPGRVNYILGKDPGKWRTI